METENGYIFYTKSRAAVEATDTTLVDRELFELYCSFAVMSVKYLISPRCPINWFIATGILVFCMHL